MIRKANAMTANNLPPSPVEGMPVVVPFDLLPEWLAYHGLEITGFDDRGWYVRSKQVQADKDGE
jgi:hypothetical protein